MEAQRSLILILILLTMGMHVMAQETETSSEPLVIQLDSIVSDDKRDEVQRYIGYEDLIFRYITLPYDLSANTNQQGRFVDLGFTFLMLLPLILLLLLYKKKKVFYTLIGSLILYLAINLSYSFMLTANHGRIDNQGAYWNDFMTIGKKTFFESISIPILNAGHWLAQPFRSFGKLYSGESDGITYPILITIFLLSLLLITKVLRLSRKGYFMALIYVGFGFIWLLLSSGIIWYGFLLYPLGYVLIAYFYNDSKFGFGIAPAFLKRLSLMILVLWVIMAYVARISNINALQITDKDIIGKGIVENNIFQYSTGMINAGQARNLSYANISDALEKINSNEDLIYRVGTFFAFDIKKNTERLVMDNTLSQFLWLVKTFGDKQEIIAALKASKFRYILVDLYTQTLDKTPEKSLTQKYMLLLNTLYKNPSVQLLATDRIVEVQGVDGSITRKNGVFGDTKNDKIVKWGSYAIYEIR